MSTTETISLRYQGLDSWGDEAILAAFIEGQERAIAAVKSAQSALAEAARAIVARLGSSGRIIYAGAGSSGLIAALDGTELGGTFGWPDDRVVFLLPTDTDLKPGMRGASEDDVVAGRAAIAALSPRHEDVLIAVAASGSTPFTLAAAGEARKAGALIIGLANNPGAPLLKQVDVPVLLDSGPEVIVGSTRMGAGTAQKAALGLLSSLTMIRLGHIYDGQMVNLRVDNAKLRKRAVAMLVAITGSGEENAARALDGARGNVKQAALVLRGLAPAEAERVLASTQGNLRAAFARLN